MVLHLTNPPLYSQICAGSNTISCYSPDGSNYYLTKLSDLNTANFTTSDPNVPIQALKSFSTNNPITTIPSNFFGAHISGLNLANGGSNSTVLYSAGVRIFRLRDTFCTLGDSSQDATHNQPNGIIYNSAALPSSAFTSSSGLLVTWSSSNAPNSSNHGLTNASSTASAYPGTPSGSAVFFYAPSGSTLPSGITQCQLYYVVQETSTTFKLSNTYGGTAISYTNSGSGTIYVFGVNIAISNPINSNNSGNPSPNGVLDYLTINQTTGVFANSRAGSVIFDCSTPPASFNGSVTNNPSASTVNTNLPGEVIPTCPATATLANFMNGLFGYIYKYYGAPAQAAGGACYFEVWNEPNDPIGSYPVPSGEGFVGSVSGNSNDLFNYSQAIHTATHSNPSGTTNVSGSTNISSWNAKVISASWTNLFPNNYSVLTGTMIPWLTGGGNTYSVGSSVIDIIGFHNYGESQVGPRASLNVMLQVAAQIKANSLTSFPVWMTEGGDSSPNQKILWRTHLVAAGLGIGAYFHYNYDASAGAINGNLPLGTSSQQLASPFTYNGTTFYSWPGVSSSSDPASYYRAMISACAGKSCSYVNLSIGYQVGTNINGVNYLF